MHWAWGSGSWEWVARGVGESRGDLSKPFFALRTTTFFYLEEKYSAG